MLDTNTKKRIDDCRDILVGKLPDPKAQIEQITIGLIYKFMDDMDKETIELGGAAKFFKDYEIPDPKDDKKKITVPFEKYSWDNLFNSKTTAVEMLSLYSAAIEGMEKNPNLPQLFRDIFNNAYLPYRDPETLKLFLKTINEFEYSHSEKLGDAFEYLLSVMGSQGDAGQFRTPRHIIDFLVSIVDPSKTDSILDPACGTAGFLISAFKHIKEKNNNELTPDQRKSLIQNFVGYDISPDMVRLSLVNLYLHGFSEPHIWEYDTLSSEERWNENFDVILANPPFMSPKGGIRPHKKFSIQSNRSEVLFVDYIAEHLTPKGKAGIIVPEGVIFQSGKAYKELRKMLVENYLYAVVSLPAGVFNPYSGVKTSILLLNKELAKKSKDILFVKIENDGFALGAQRNEIKGSQIDEAIKVINTFKNSILKGNDFENSEIGHIVDKKEVGKEEEYNLSGERYKVREALRTDYPIVSLGEICQNLDGKRIPITKSDRIPGAIPYYGASGIVDYVKDFLFDEELLLVSEDGANLLARVTPIAFSVSGRVWVNNHAHVLKFESKFTQKYVEYILNSMSLKPYITGAAQPKLNQKALKSIKFPLPPISIQEDIVAELEGYKKIIDGAKMVVDNYIPRIDIDESWEMVELRKVCKIKGGYAFKSSEYTDKGALVIRMGNVKMMFFDHTNNPKYLPKSFLESHISYVLKKGDILISMTGTIGKEDYGNVCMVDRDGDFLLNQRVGKFEIISSTLNNEFLYLCANQDWFRKQIFRNSSGGVRQSNISNKGIEATEIPIPPIKTQKQIVMKINEEQELVKSNKKLIVIFEQKIKERITKIWGE